MMVAIDKSEVESLRDQVVRLNKLWQRAVAELAACRTGTTVAEIAAEIESSIGVYEKSDNMVRVGERKISVDSKPKVRDNELREGDLF